MTEINNGMYLAIIYFETCSVEFVTKLCIVVFLFTFEDDLKLDQNIGEF